MAKFRDSDGRLFSVIAILLIISLALIACVVVYIRTYCLFKCKQMIKINIFYYISSNFIILIFLIKFLKNFC